MAKATISSSAQLRPCPRLRHNGSVLSSVRHRRCQRRAVTCAAADADADVVGLFDAAKLTVGKFVKSGMVVGLGSGPASGLRHPVPRHATSAGISNWHRWNTLVHAQCK